MEFLWPCKKKKKEINCHSAPAKLTTIFFKPIYLKYLCLTSFSWNASLCPPEPPCHRHRPRHGPFGWGEAESCPQHGGPLWGHKPATFWLPILTGSGRCGSEGTLEGLVSPVLAHGSAPVLAPLCVLRATS